MISEIPQNQNSSFALWPDQWPKPSNPLFKAMGKPAHRTLALRVLPALNIKNERLDEIDSLRNQALSKYGDKVQRIQFKTADGLAIDGAIIWQSRDPNQPWILYFNGNAECYEDNLTRLVSYSNETECNLLAFNYRGVCYSEGEPYEASDLTLDGDAAFQYLQRQGVAENRILIHARSLGGAVGTHVRSLHPDGPICNERSFSSWAKLEAKHLGKHKAFILKKLLEANHWEFTPIEKWEKIRGRKWIIVSPTDEVIDFETASFFEGVHTTGKEHSEDVIELPKLYSLMRGGAGEGHNVPLTCKEFSDSWEEHKNFIRKCFE